LAAVAVPGAFAAVVFAAVVHPARPADAKPTPDSATNVLRLTRRGGF
jgi:hypothetical protein